MMGVGKTSIGRNLAKKLNFTFVDIDKIGATGHSMGGNAAIRGADFFW